MKLKAMFSVEAAILMPFLIMITIFAMYMVVYVYDRALMVQDTNRLVTAAEESDEAFKKVTAEILEYHPYICVSDMEVKRSEGDKTQEPEVSIGFDWKLPLWSGFDKTMLYEKNVSLKDPTEIMIETDDFMSMTEGDEEDGPD